jgi:hypothetical protein
MSKSSVHVFVASGVKVFSFDVMDYSATVRVKAFNCQCERVFALIVIGEV